MNQNCNNNNNTGGNNNNNNGNGGNGARGRAFVIGAGEARNDPNVVTGKFFIDDHFATILFDSGADYSYVSLEFSKLLKTTPIPLNSKHIIEVASGKHLEATHIHNGCTLELSGTKLVSISSPSPSAVLTLS